MIAQSKSSYNSNKDIYDGGGSSTNSNAGRIWNRFADFYAKQPIKDEEAYQMKLDLTQQHLKKDTSRVLELGCGTGGTALLHAPFCREIVAADASSRMIEIAKEKQQQQQEEQPSGKNVKFVCNDVDSVLAEAAGSPHGGYDVVLALNLLHLLPNKDQVVKQIHDSDHILTPGGYFITSTPCLGDFVPSIVTRWIAPLLNWVGLLPALAVFSKEELRQTLQEAGFEIEHEFHPAPDKAVFLVAKKVEGQ